MKAQVLYKYDSDMKEDVWIQSAELPDPEIEKASDVIVRIGAAGVCRTDLHIIEGVFLANGKNHIVTGKKYLIDDG